MTSAEVHAAVALVLGLLVVFPCLALLMWALFPGAVRGAQAQAGPRPLRSLVAGAAVTGPGLVATAVLGNLPGPAKPASGLLFALLFLYAFVGVAGLAGHVGARLPSPGDAARSWLPTLRGALVLEGACGLPFIGWFVLAPLALVAGAGALTIALFSRTTSAAAAPSSSSAASSAPPAPLASVEAAAPEPLSVS